MHFKKLGASRNYREESGEFLCDGMKLLEEAVSSGVIIPAILAAAPIPYPLSVDTRVYYADRGLIDSLSPLKNAQDILFTCKISDKWSVVSGQETGERDSCQGSEVSGKETGECDSGQWSVVSGQETMGRDIDHWSDIGGTHLLLDGVQDPGNVGSVIRTANAFKIKSVILYNGCADAYNPKTIRASMGAVFRQHFCKMDISELTALKDSGVRFFGAALDKNCRAIFDVKLDDAVIAIGNEGAGLSEGILSLCDELITIPISADCESLNAAVAAAIIMWEARGVQYVSA